MLNNFSVHSFLIQSVKLKGFPPTIIGILLSLFPHVAGTEYYFWAGIPTIELLYSCPVGIFLGIGTLAYMYVGYQKEWFGGRSKNNSTKYFKILSFAFIGLVAALVPYYLGVGNFFLGTMDTMSGGENQIPLLMLSGLTIGIGFMLNDMFRSLDGKSGIFYKIPPLNKTPMKKYSKMEYRVKKLFKEI